MVLILMDLRVSSNLTATVSPNVTNTLMPPKIVSSHLVPSTSTLHNPYKAYAINALIINEMIAGINLTFISQFYLLNTGGANKTSFSTSGVDSTFCQSVIPGFHT